ncbi:hypothetical protein GCM10017557_23520 [Streptomyces aurantiacus]|uniref:Uncharacterized protein n=1 Tax=Streptomyces aurantiacus TaxID=47760 RepID=A0A7G1NVT9_9ACTN|nr:hypothetical protein GCM10017557_23520 [Streptomyces aurantiacus]
MPPAATAGSAVRNYETPGGAGSGAAGVACKGLRLTTAIRWVERKRSAPTKLSEDRDSVPQLLGLPTI